MGKLTLWKYKNDKLCLAVTAVSEDCGALSVEGIKLWAFSQLSKKSLIKWEKRSLKLACDKFVYKILLFFDIHLICTIIYLKYIN